MDYDNERTTDCKNRRVILRHYLYQDIDWSDGHEYDVDNNVSLNSLQAPDQDDTQNLSVQQSFNPGFDWTQHNWQKSGQTSVTSTKSNPKVHLPKQKKNNMQNKLTAALAQPIRISKAESMMQKMGWQGGALGKTGDGIIVPIAPNAVYATRTLGFGQQAEKKPLKSQKIQKQPHRNVKNKKIDRWDYFKTNVLVQILEFVKNDAEVEVVFDPKLFKRERFFIHQVIEKINNSDEMMIMTDFDSITQMDLLQEIRDYNIYILGSQSEGEHPDRQLCLYKEGPEHMYLVTPADLRDYKNQNENDCNIESSKENCALKILHVNKTEENKIGFEVKNDTPLNSVANNTREPQVSKIDDSTTEKFKEFCINNTDGYNFKFDILVKLMEFLSEFIENDDYTELRFIGIYNSEETETLRYFINNYCKLMHVFRDCGKELDGKSYVLDYQETVYGFPIIYKLINCTGLQNDQ